MRPFAHAVLMIAALAPSCWCDPAAAQAPAPADPATRPAPPPEPDTRGPGQSPSALDRADPARATDRSLRNLADRPQPSVPPTVVLPDFPAADTSITIGAIDLTGLEILPRSAFSDIVEDYLGRNVSGTELADLVERLAARARATYPLATVIIEPQRLATGILRIRIDEGRIDAVRIDGPQNPAMLRALAPLATGRPVAGADLERRLLIAGDVDGALLGKARIEREEGRNTLVVKAWYERVDARISIDNDSTPALGPVELFGSLRVNGILAPDDTLQLFALDTVPDVSELAFLRVRYGKRVSHTGTELSLTGSYSRSRPGDYLTPFAIAGDSWLAAIGVLHPLIRSRATSLWLDGSLSHREVRQDRADRLIRRDRLTVARAGVYGYTPLAGGRLRLNAELAQGLDLLGATEPGDRLASRADADGTFTSLVFGANWAGTVAGPVGASLAVRSQLAAQPLLLSEEVGLGGANYVRGYEYSERSGDLGTMAYGEVNVDLDDGFGLVRDLELYAFADGGKVDNLDGGFGGGSLFSTGGGVRAELARRLDAGVEIAVPLSAPRFESGDKSPRIRFSVTRGF